MSGVRQRIETDTRRRMLVLDASYTLETIKAQGMENSVYCRDLGCFFDHVWSVHPFASMLTLPGWTDRFGRPVWHRLNERHTFVEGKLGRYSWLAWAGPINFLIGQVGLFLTLLRLVRRERINLIRVGDPLYLGLFGLALARLTRRPLMIRVNGNNDKIRENTGRPLYPRLFPSIALEKRIERFVFPRADLVAAPNQDNVDFSVANGAHPERMTIFPYGNLLAKEHLRDPAERGCDSALFERLRISPGGYLLCVGRLQAVKFPDDAIRVLRGIRRRSFDVTLVMAGDGPMREELGRLAASEGVADHVRFPGNLDQATLAQLATHAAAVISPLTGRALSECALGGAPIVAYDLDWQGDLIQTGATGELVPFRNVEAMEAGVAKFLEDRAYAAAMGKGARERARDMLDPERLDQHERSVIGALLSQAPAAA